MRKRTEKKFSISSAEWSKAPLSIVEANQTQQTVILRFNEKGAKADYALCSCRISPLINVPEKILDFYFEFSDENYSVNDKLYIVFAASGSDVDETVSKDNEGNFVLTKTPLAPFDLRDDEVIGLLRRNEETDTWHLIDWSKPIIDEPISLDTLKEMTQTQFEDASANFYKSDKKPAASSELKMTGKNNIHFFEKPLLWLFIFIITISMFEAASLLMLSESPTEIILKSFVILSKNVFTGFLVFLFIRKNFKFNSAVIVFFILSILSHIIGYLYFASSAIIGSAILLFCISIFTFLTRSAK